MGRQLTQSEWDETPVPMYWIKASSIKAWPKVQVDMLEKWLTSNTKGWFYHSDDYWVFEKTKDRVIFKMFVMSDHFTEDIGTIESSP